MSAEWIVGIAVGVIAIVTAVISVVRWIVSVAGKVKDTDNELSKVADDLLQTRADITDDLNQLRHSVKNERQRIDALDQQHTRTVERVVKVEATLEALKQGQDRIERGQEKGFDTLAQSIREIRMVAPKT